MSVIGIIPARGGSKGIPGKNLAIVGNKSLLDRAIETAKKSGIIDRIIVDSDSDEIIAAARKHCGVEILYKRPAHLATDVAATADVILYLLQWLNINEQYKPDIIVLLEPTCPLRSANDIRQAYRVFVESGRPCLITISDPIQETYNMIQQGESDWNYALPRLSNSKRRQDFPETRFINGGAYITKADFFLTTGKFYDLQQMAVHVMPQERSIDINTPFDLSLARYFAAQLER
jgi:CMP-N,N'-diacetyllegionaminic acid synthase